VWGQGFGPTAELLPGRSDTDFDVSREIFAPERRPEGRRQSRSPDPT
jgi:hypothetical protein